MSTSVDFQLEKRIVELKSHICRVVRTSDIVHFMVGFLPQVDKDEIAAAEKHGAQKATFLLLQKVQKCDLPGKWTAFVEALENAEYPYVASLLRCKDKKPEEYKHQKRILEVFAPYLDQVLEPCEIIPHLREVSLVSSVDIEEIKACQREKGSSAATMMMLDRIQRRQAPETWYTKFLRILYQKGYQDLVRDMEPDFSLDCEVMKVPTICVQECQDYADDDDCGKLIESKIELRVELFKTEMAESIKLEKIVPSLLQLIDFETLTELMMKSQISPSEAIKSLTEHVGSMTSTNKWRLFVNCLRQADYPYLADLLTRSYSSCTGQREKRILRLFSQTLGPQLEPQELIPCLIRHSVINQQDKEEIMTTLHHSGSTAASFVLLECIQCRLDPKEWYRRFLVSLQECGRDDLVKEIEPGFFNRIDSAEGHVKDIAEDKENHRTGQVSHLHDALEAACSHAHNLDKSAKEAVRNIRKDFEDREKKVLTQIDTRKVKLTKMLKKTEEKLRNINNDSVATQEDNQIQALEELIRSVLETNYHVRPTEYFQKSTDIAIILDSIKQVKRGYLEEFPSANDETMPTSEGRVAPLLPRSRHLSTSSAFSSSSSQSSGYVVVGAHSSSGITPSEYVKNKFSKILKGLHKVSFASVEDTRQEQIEKSQVRRSTWSTGSANFKADYLQFISRQKTSQRRTRTVSESSVLSTEGSEWSSVDKASSFTTISHSTETLSSSGMSNESTKTQGKALAPFERTDSYIYHRKIRVPCRNKCILSSLCALPKNKIIITDQECRCVYIYDDMTGQFTRQTFSKLIPVDICNVLDNLVFILFRGRDAKSKLAIFELSYKDSGGASKSRPTISFREQVRAICLDDFHTIAGNNERVGAFCGNRHIHFFCRTGTEIQDLHLKVSQSEWWPQYSAMDFSSSTAFVYDIYTSHVYCFNTRSGFKLWGTTLTPVDGMAVSEDSLYVSQNTKHRIEVLSKINGNKLRCIKENVHCPFAMCSSFIKGVIIVTQYHPEGRMLNRIVKYF